MAQPWQIPDARLEELAQAINTEAVTAVIGAEAAIHLSLAIGELRYWRQEQERAALYARALGQSH